MADNNTPNPDDDEFRNILGELLSGNSPIDSSQLAGAAGLPGDPESVAAIIRQLQTAIHNPASEGVNWSLATDQAVKIANQSAATIGDDTRAQLEQAFHVAGLWLGEVIFMPELSAEPKLWTRAEWVRATMPVWTQLAEPVATSISRSLTNVLTEQAPEEFKDAIAGAGHVMRAIGGALFAMQLGHVVGQLSAEVVSGGDVGIPLLPEQQAALLPQNVHNFGHDLDVPADQIAIYLAVRELAHARLFRYAKWLRLQLMSSVTEFARGIRIDTSRLESLADDFDPANPEQIRQAMVDGSLIPPKTDEQKSALARLETTLALIEGWVDAVTADATRRLPKAEAIAETVRRRRASRGPAESAFSTLVGLELRPRRLREAARMWGTIAEAVGSERRDALWSHPDLVPTSEDISNPEGLVEKLQNPQGGADGPRDEVDKAIEDLLRNDGPKRPSEDSPPDS